MEQSVTQLYGNRVRVRVCGLLTENDCLLLVNHRGLSESDFWSPPGGGIQPGESASVALARELEEETGLIVNVRDFLFACEFIQEPLHAVELFFRVERAGGELHKGHDPEMEAHQQLIQEVRWVSFIELQKWPHHQLHGIFRKVEKPAQIMDLRGYFSLLAVAENH